VANDKEIQMWPFCLLQPSLLREAEQVFRADGDIEQVVTLKTRYLPSSKYDQVWVASIAGQVLYAQGPSRPGVVWHPTTIPLLEFNQWKDACREFESASLDSLKDGLLFEIAWIDRRTRRYLTIRNPRKSSRFSDFVRWLNSTCAAATAAGAKKGGRGG
jgi:hypothetical protein